MSYVFVSLAALLWGSVAAVAKLLLADLNNVQVLFLSNVFAFLGLLCIVVFKKKMELICSYTKQDYSTFAWMGFLGAFLYTFFLYGALQLLPAQEAFIVNYLWPVLVVVFAVWILKEHITVRKILGIACSFLGVVIVITKGDFVALQFSNVLGILSAVAGAFVFGLFSVLGKTKQYDKLVSMMFYYLFAIFYSLVAVLIFSEIPALSMRELLGLVWLGAFTSGFAFVFWFLALKYGDTAKMSNIILLTPFISLVYIYFLVGEKILPSSVVGLAVIVLGILIQSSFAKAMGVKN